MIFAVLLTVLAVLSVLPCLLPRCPLSVLRLLRGTPRMGLTVRGNGSSACLSGPCFKLVQGRTHKLVESLQDRVAIQPMNSCKYLQRFDFGCRLNAVVTLADDSRGPAVCIGLDDLVHCVDILGEVSKLGARHCAQLGHYLAWPEDMAGCAES